MIHSEEATEPEQQHEDSSIHVLGAYGALDSIVLSPEAPHRPLRHSKTLLSEDLDLFSQIEGNQRNVCSCKSAA